MIKPGRIIVASLCALALLVGSAVSAMAQDAGGFPDIAGTWAGSYKVAFPHDHAVFHDQSVAISMELEVYRQEANLIWVVNRWRRDGQDDWIVEYGTGAFDLKDRSELIITERGPADHPHATVGLFSGAFDDETLYLTYSSFTNGVTFSVALERE